MKKSIFMMVIDVIISAKTIIYKSKIKNDKVLEHPELIKLKGI